MITTRSTEPDPLSYELHRLTNDGAGATGHVGGVWRGLYGSAQG